MKSVEITSKDKFKDTIKEIVRKLQIRCRDHELLNDVLRKAGKKLEADLSLSPVERAKLNPRKGAESKKSQVEKLDSHNGIGQTSIDDSESISVSSSDSSSGVSSVEVSSVDC